MINSSCPDVNFKNAVYDSGVESLQATLHWQMKSAKIFICPKGKKIETCKTANRIIVQRDNESATVIKPHCLLRSSQPEALKIFTVIPKEASQHTVGAGRCDLTADK